MATRKPPTTATTANGTSRDHAHGPPRSSVFREGGQETDFLEEKHKAECTSEGDHRPCLPRHRSGSHDWEGCHGCPSRVNALQRPRVRTSVFRDDSEGNCCGGEKDFHRHSYTGKPSLPSTVK